MYAKLPDGRKNLFQWDTDQYMEVSDDVHKIDFVYRENPDMEYGVFARDRKVKIPNAMLQRSGVMDALVVSKKHNGTATYIRMEIPVFERIMPPGYIMTDSGPVSADQVQNSLENLHLLSTYGGTMEGDINMDGRSIRGLVDPVEGDEATRKSWTDFTYLRKDGGAVTGRFTGFQKPLESSEPATKAYTDEEVGKVKKDLGVLTSTVNGKRLTFSSTLGTGWAGAGPYTQILAVSGIRASDFPHITPVYSNNAATALAQMESWGCVSAGVAKDGGILFTCLEDKPETAIPIQIEVLR